MKKFTSLLIGCSLALAGAAMAQQPEEQQSPSKNKKQGTEKTTEAKPQATARGATNEGVPGKGRKGKAKSETAQETNVSGQPAASATPSAEQGRKGKKGRAANQESANVSGSPAASPVLGAEQGRKGKKGRAAKTETSPAASPAAATAASAAPATGASQQNVAAGGKGKAKKLESQQVQQIKTQHANFRAQPKPEKVPAVTFNQSRRIEGSERWQGPQYEVFRSYRPERHDQGWYQSHYTRVELIGGGYYYWNSGYWYPAWGYNPSNEYYAYDGPIYVGHRAEPPDQVIADVQAELQQMGYYRGEVDGLLGPLTREALAAYQADQGLTPTAAIDQPTLDSLEMG